MSERKYSISEINRMRDDIRWSYPTEVSYSSKERDADIENRLRTYMQNGTTPEELAEYRNHMEQADGERHAAIQRHYAEQHAKQCPPRILKTAEDVIDEWFETCVAKYDGASVTAKELYDGFGGRTMKSFANKKAPDGVNITQRDMEKFLDRKGVKSRYAMFAKRYDGVRHIVSGNVRSGNYST